MSTNPKQGPEQPAQSLQVDGKKAHSLLHRAEHSLDFAQTKTNKGTKTIKPTEESLVFTQGHHNLNNSGEDTTLLQPGQTGQEI